jgi:hypothetical protein
MAKFPKKLHPYLCPNEEALTPEDCIDFITLSAWALRHCHLGDHSRVSVHEAIEASESLLINVVVDGEIDNFTGLDIESARFQELTPKGWAQLAHFAGKRLKQLNS